jgi:hypothetical protein
MPAGGRGLRVKGIAHVLILAAMGAYALASPVPRLLRESGACARRYRYLLEALKFPGPTPSAVHTIGAILTVFGGPLLIAVLSLLSLVGRLAPARPTVVVAVATWSTFVVGATLSVISTDLPLGLGPGFWVQSASAGVAIMGSLVLLIPQVHGHPADEFTDQRPRSPG